MVKKVPVDIWAKRYETSAPIEGAEIIDLPTGEHWTTGKDGYAHAMVEPGRTLTLVFNKSSMHQQTASVEVPAEGLVGHDKEITFQVSGKLLSTVLMAAFGKPEDGKHHVITTVSAFGHDMHNDEGEAGATVILRSADGTVRRDGYYMGEMNGKTEWFTPIIARRFPRFAHLMSSHTTADGGVAFTNVPPGDYTLEARKTDGDGRPIAFKTAQVKILPNSPEVVNVSPPHSPRRLSSPGPSAPRSVP